MQTLAHDALMLQGSFGLLDDPARSSMEAILQESLLWSPGYRIAGGTDDILRNILAERVLGLPGDLRTDKDVPFRERAPAPG
jgi:alkylation response protein AidB-like acyl-CoA dehydrogenase